MKIRLGELRTVIREVLSETYDDWKTATPPEYDVMGDEPCDPPCADEENCHQCNGADPSEQEPPDEDMLGMNRGRGER